MTPRRRGVPVQAAALYCGIVAALALLSRYPSPFPLLDPALVAAALFLYSPVVRYRRGPPPSWIRIDDARRSVVLLASLAAAGALAFALYRRLPLPPALAPYAGPVPALGGMAVWQAFIVAFPEEVFFRGYLYDAFAESGLEPVLWTAALFALAHVAILPSAFRALTFFPALLFGWARKKTGNAYVPGALHFLFNLYPYLAGGLP